MDPDHPKVYLEEGKALQILGRHAEAAECFAKQEKICEDRIKGMVPPEFFAIPSGFTMKPTNTIEKYLQYTKNISKKRQFGYYQQQLSETLQHKGTEMIYLNSKCYKRNLYLKQENS
jgi:hypothetical protein